MRQIYSAGLVCAGLLLAGCSGSSSPPPSPVALQSDTFPVVTGASDATAAFEVLRYYPSTIVIDAGDTLTWTIASGSPHVIAYLPAGQKAPNPPANTQAAGGTTVDGTTFVSSGLIGKGATYALTFPSVGTYTILCLVHQPEMMQTVSVQSAGASRPATAAQYTAAANAQSAADVIAAQGTLSAFPFAPGGTHLAVGLAPKVTPPSVLSIFRFLDGPSLSTGVTVPVGTTLTWTNVSNVPHNIAFPVAGQSIPATFNDVGPALGGASYDGSALTSSGFLTPGLSYSLTFTRAGRYTYFCTLHDFAGMQSEVTVL